MTEAVSLTVAGILAFLLGCLALVLFAVAVTSTRLGCWIIGEHDRGIQVWTLGRPGAYVVKCRRCRKPL